MLGVDEEEDTTKATRVVADVAPTEESNPYLQGLDLHEPGTDSEHVGKRNWESFQGQVQELHKAAKPHKDGENLLATFSFDDDSAAPEEEAAAPVKVAAPAADAPKVNNAFLNYLGLTK